MAIGVVAPLDKAWRKPTVLAIFASVPYMYLLVISHANFPVPRGVQMVWSNIVLDASVRMFSG